MDRNNHRKLIENYYLYTYIYNREIGISDNTKIFYG